MGLVDYSDDESPNSSPITSVPPKSTAGPSQSACLDKSQPKGVGISGELFSVVVLDILIGGTGKVSPLPKSISKQGRRAPLAFLLVTITKHITSTAHATVVADFHR